MFLNTFEDHEALELLLYYAIPQKDTNAIAHDLLQHFGSYREVMQASREALMEVPGVGERTAVLLTLVRDLSRRYEVQKFPKRYKIRNTQDAVNYVTPLFTYSTEEKFYLLCLNSSHEIIRCHLIRQGLADCVSFTVRDIVDHIMKDAATSVLLAHNHPTQYAIPSGEDLNTTRVLQDALRLIDVEIMDHVIISDDGDAISFRESGFL